MSKKVIYKRLIPATKEYLNIQGKVFADTFQEISAIQPKSSTFDYLEVEAQKERWKRARDLDSSTTTEGKCQLE